MVFACPSPRRVLISCFAPSECLPSLVPMLPTLRPDASYTPFRCFLSPVRKHSNDRCKASERGVDDVCSVEIVGK